MATREIKVPDIGDFKDIPVIEMLVKPGDAVAKDAPLVTLESDKATMEVPSPQAGTVKEMRVKMGDKVSQGSVILVLEPGRRRGAGSGEPGDAKPEPKAEKKAEAPAPAPPQPAPAASRGRYARCPGRGARDGHRAAPRRDLHAEVLVLGAGPGGYTAAFRAADLGKKVVLVERYPRSAASA